MTGVKAPLSCDMKLDWEKEKAFCLGATGAGFLTESHVQV
jgi:hypothetical protein